MFLREIRYYTILMKESGTSSSLVIHTLKQNKNEGAVIPYLVFQNSTKAHFALFRHNNNLDDPRTHPVVSHYSRSLFVVVGQSRSILGLSKVKMRFCDKDPDFCEK